jgi:hypothetical protein
MSDTSSVLGGVRAGPPVERDIEQVRPLRLNSADTCPVPVSRGRVRPTCFPSGSPRRVEVRAGAFFRDASSSTEWRRNFWLLNSCFLFSVRRSGAWSGEFVSAALAC